MDYLPMSLLFLNVDPINSIAVYGRIRELSEFIKNIFICVPKMNERHGGKWNNIFILGWSNPWKNQQI